MTLMNLLRLLSLSTALLSGLCFAVLAPIDAPTVPTLSRACGHIVNSQDGVFFNASIAYECLTSVPFNPAVASRFLEYYRYTLQFQSTLTYLKNPPPSYQQPAVDLIQGLDELESAIAGGLFPNQYEFEAALQTLLYATHDAHVSLNAGILAVFSFASPYDIVSLSVDGVQVPMVYLAVDLEDSNYFTDYQPSAIATINGESTVTYLTKYAFKNSVGMVEPHADWNQLMASAALDIQGSFTVFGGDTTFYPGDIITFTLENGTVISDNFIAIYNTQGNTGPLETGGDFYNSFVLGLLPASFDENLINNNNINITAEDEADTASLTTGEAIMTVMSTEPTPTSASTPTPACTNSWFNPAYPDCPDVAQSDLGTFGAGFISAYFLNDTSVAVLSIPSFDADDDAIDSFDSTIEEFLSRGRSIGIKKVVIDVQSNTGGKTLLAIATFKHFFPNIDPYGGSRLRATDASFAIGQALTAYFEDTDPNSNDFDALITDEWVSTPRINAETGQTFADWSEFFGPETLDGDNFTTVQRYNLSNTAFDDAAVDGDSGNFTVFGYGANPGPAPALPPFAAEDILMLSDGICSSACALFMEMMRHEAGVKVVAAGGRPNNGPMQAPSGNRGAAMQSTDVLDANIDLAQRIYQSANFTDAEIFDTLPNRTEALDVYVTFASINLRDQVRKDESIPLQFEYQAADCRIWYTPQTIYNYTALWQYAADAIWSSKSLCVAGSTGFAKSGTNETDFEGPTPSANLGAVEISDITAHLTNTSSLDYLTNLNDGLEDDNPLAVKAKAIPCQTTTDCTDLIPNTLCASVKKSCLSSGKIGPAKVCVLRCQNIGGSCSTLSRTGGTCKSDQKICGADGLCRTQSSSNAEGFGAGGRTAVPGVCLARVSSTCSLPADIRIGPSPNKLKFRGGN